MIVHVNGARLFHTLAGAGTPVVLVHGSWGDHHSWDAVGAALAGRYTVIAYDRRGHSSSAAPGRVTVHDHAADLAALGKALGLGAVHVLASSFGASVALRAVALHPDRFLSLAAHEPPLMRTLDPRGPLSHDLQAFGERVGRVEALLRANRAEAAARTFVEEVALGPGAWDGLPAHVRDTLVRNARTFLAEIDDPDALDLDLAMLSAYRGPVLLSRGERSPPLFGGVVERIATALPQAERHVYAGAGHVPHMTHPEAYLERTAAFLAAAGAGSATGHRG